MSIIGLVTGDGPKRVVISRDEKDAPGLTLDATISIVPTREVTISKNPVESGGNITDNAVLGNLKVSIEAIVSEAPLASGLLDAALGAIAGVAGGLIGTTVGGLGTSLLTAGVAAGANAAKNFALSTNVVDGKKTESSIADRQAGDTDYPRKAYEYLLGIQQSRDTLKIVSRLKTYNSLLMTSISNPQSIKMGKSIKFTAVFEEIQIVTSSTVTIPENVISFDATGASSKGKLGKQGTTEATAAQEKNTSFLKGLVNGFGG